MSLLYSSEARVGTNGQYLLGIGAESTGLAVSHCPVGLDKWEGREVESELVLQ